jgi:hypothetical protein
MPIFFYCPKCYREIRVKTKAAGRRGRCTDCGASVVVPNFAGEIRIEPQRYRNSSPRPSSSEIEMGFLDKTQELPQMHPERIAEIRLNEGQANNDSLISSRPGQR